MTEQKDVLVLAIESSCDETAAAVVKNGREVLSNIISSQIALHTLYGGVVPEIASRKHIEKINQVIEQALADARGVDLVKIAPMAKPPVCKIMDYGKFRFEQSKREKEARKNQRIVDIKEIRLSLYIDTHDFNTKLKHASKFIANGSKVKVSIRFRGREMGHPEIGYETMKKFAEQCAEFANVEKPAKLDGRNMLMFLAPKPGK